MSASPYDCQTCGACCIDYFRTPGYIQLTPGEAQRMRRLGLPVVSVFGQLELGTKPYDGGESGCEVCCSAFVGRVGGECACSIHPDRPGACRRFEAGSEMCKCAREEAGLPV
jgi:Fe-S-cluster containining protein